MPLRLAITLTSLILLLATGCGSGSSTRPGAKTGSPAPKMGTTTTPTPTSPSTSASATTAPHGTCSATGRPAHATDQPGLPAAVAATRRELLAAAAACDFDALQAIALRHRDQFAWAQGDPAPAPPAAYWRTHDATDRTMARLVALLNSPHATSTGDPRSFVWPAVQGDARTAADWQALVASGAYSAREVAAMRRDDLYYGYRIGILADGTWSYFATGD